MAEAQVKKGRGCFFYGCLTLVIIVILIAVLAFVGGKIALNKMTSTTPLKIPPTVLEPTQGNRVVQRVRDFTEELKSGRPVAPLELTGDELDYVVRNARIDYRDTLHLVVTNDQIHADLSIPLFVINPRLKGRYFNQSTTFKVNVANGGLDLNFDKDMPGVKKNFHWTPANANQGADLFRNLEKIEVEDGKVTLIPKNTPTAAPAAAPAAKP